jgi:hypothetical protein
MEALSCLLMAWLDCVYELTDGLSQIQRLGELLLIKEWGVFLKSIEVTVTPYLL